MRKATSFTATPDGDFGDLGYLIAWVGRLSSKQRFNVSLRQTKAGRLDRHRILKEIHET